MVHFEFSNEKNGKKYNWQIKFINDSLDISITDTTNLVNSLYQKTYSKNELENISKLFILFDDMNLIFLQIEEILKNGKYEFYENDKSIKIFLKTDIIPVKKIELAIPIKKNKDMNITKKQLYKYIQETEERVKILEKENQEIKRENQEIKKIINLKNSNYNYIQFNKELYEKELNIKIDKILKNFQNDIENKINNIDLEKNKLIKTQINTLIQNYSNNQKQILLKKDENNNELQKKLNIVNEDFNNIYLMGSLVKNVDNNNDNKNKIEIMNEKIEKELSTNFCKFIMFDNIILKHIGKENIKKLYFAKDEKQSSKNIIFIGNNKNDNDNLNKLTLDGEFKPSDESSQSLNLRIISPKINNKYILIIYVREEENGPNLSNPLKIVINVKESDEERKKREKEEKEKKKEEEEMEKRINDLFIQLNEAFNSTLIKEEIEKKIIKYNFDQLKITDWILEKEKFKNIDYKGLNKDDVEDIYDELVEEFNINSILDKKDVINKIIELKCDRDELNNWIFEIL